MLLVKNRKVKKMRCVLRKSKWCVYNVKGMCYYSFTKNEKEDIPSEEVCSEDAPYLYPGQTVDGQILVRVYSDKQLGEEIRMMDTIVKGAQPNDPTDRMSVAETKQIKELCGDWLENLVREESDRGKGERWTPEKGSLRELWK